MVYKRRVKGSVRDFYNFNNRIAKFVFFVGDNNYNKCVSVPFYKGLVVFYLNVLARYGVFVPL